jgi:hypothetical protein
MKKIFGLLFIAGLTGSCKKLIEIPANPPTEITQDQQFADSSNTLAALAGVYSYSAGTGQGFGYDDGNLPACAGLSSDELSYSNTSADLLSFYSYGLTQLNSYVNSLWSGPYTNLYVVNAALSGVGGSNGLSASFRSQVTGEMKVVRALYYFHLVNLFGGLPLVTSIDYRANAVLPRASVDSVYGRVIADLTDAQKELTAAYPSAGHVRPNLYTATALLAKVYLYRQQWQQAYDAAGVVIGSGVYSLETDLNKVFLDGSREAIWQLPATGPNEVTADASNFVPSTSGTAPYYILTTFLLNAFETGDQRLQKWTAQAVVSGQAFYYPYKYKNRLTSSPTTEDYMIFRLGELYLIRAEAAAQLGHTTDALSDLNTVRARAGLSASTADPSSQSDVLSAIQHERQVELFCEWGNRWFDLKRMGRAGTVLGAEKTGWTDDAALYPLPQAELQMDVQLKQNPGY